MASSLVMSRAADHDWRAYLLTAVCTLIFVRTKINPLIVVAAAGVIGYLASSELAITGIARRMGNELTSCLVEVLR